MWMLHGPSWTYAEKWKQYLHAVNLPVYINLDRGRAIYAHSGRILYNIDTLNYIRSEMIDPQGFSGEGSEVVLVSL